MKARITLTPVLLKRLMDGIPLQFKFPEAATEVELVIEDDIFAKFERVFDKIWDKALDKLGKLT